MRSNRGAMEISLGWFLVFVMCLGIFFVGPVVIIANHRDNTITAKGQAIIDETVQEVAVTGKLTQEMVAQCEESLNSLGEVWNVEITWQAKDENPLVKSAKATSADGTTYIVYYDTNVRDLLAKNGEIRPKTDDIITFEVTKESTSIADSFSGAKNNETGKVTIKASAKVSGK